MPYIQVENLTIHYKIEGNGSPLLLLHGMGSNSRSWRNQLEGLKDHFTVIAWDAPGYGKSSDPSKAITTFKQFAKILKGFLEKLNLDSIYLLGHSMGSVLALDFCCLYPEVVKALILADGTRGNAAGDAELNERKLRNRLVSIETLTPQEIAKQRVGELLAPNAPEEVRREAERLYSEIRPAGYRSVAYSLYNANQTGLLPLINIPTLVICGELDKVTPVRESEILHAGIAKSELVIIPGTGHLCYQENPAAFNHHVLEFLKKHEQMYSRKGEDSGAI
ncbi:alpha/beta fold hydrolase [Effusibacillus pohliae]|uniref:alpha/beta fold hydrolase n=1 Tax=Effusibacillus pohliae TaxID=232270 RepID=UPI00035C3AF2|nr:alpha/beta hydrolase [Effusibacillus pohliae]